MVLSIRGHRARLAALILAFGAGAAAAEQRGSSEWVSVGPDGNLAYKTTERGDRIMDFSHAGYMGGGVAIPDVPVKKTVQPSGREGGDDTDAIQSAIDEVAKLPPDSNGFRGAVLLWQGTFSCANTININASGVVLRGSGADSSTIKLTGQPHVGVSVRGREGGEREPGDQKESQTNITDPYVPSGATSITVANAARFKVGDTIVIRRPVTEAWVKFMQMDDLTREGKPQTWIKPGGATMTERNIAAIRGNTITLDVSLTDSFDAKYLNPPGATVARVSSANRLTQCGVEKLRIICPPQAFSHNEQHFGALRINGQDCWARDLVAEETMDSVAVGGRRITLQNVAVIRKGKHQGASKPAEFAPNGTQVLMDRCRVEADNIWFVATGSGVSGPMVVLNCTFSGSGSRAESHQRWSTGILYDNIRAPGSGIELRNRGAMGSGHGWTMGWGVVWNCVTGHYIVQNPPGALNWVIGSIGENNTAPRPFNSGPMLPGATIDSPGKPVAPQSLYLAQLKERLGEQALKNIGYDSPDIGDTASQNSAEHSKRADANGSSGPDLAIDRPVTTSNFAKMDVRFAGWNALDGDDNTYWRANASDLPASLEFDTEGAVQINTIVLGEALDHLDAVQSYKLEAMIDSAWKPLADGTTIGQSKVHHFPQITVWKVRLTIDKTSGDYAAVRKISIYLDAPPEVQNR